MRLIFLNFALAFWRQFLFIVVVTLFGFMNVGAVIGFIADMRERKTTLARLQEADTGFEEACDGAWTWSCAQAPITRRAVEAPSGSAMVLSAIFGLPFVRLRAALPEVLFAGSVGQALGRKAGLSVQGLADAREDNVDVMQQLAAALSCCAAPRQQFPTVRADGGGGGAATDEEHGAGEDDGDASRIVGTALVFAFMANAKTLPVTEHARRVAAASLHFRGAALRGCDHGFDELLRMFLVMLSPGNLSSRDDWLEKSRLWRCILLQRADGGFDLGEPLAFALEAHPGPRPPRAAPKSRLASFIGNLIEGDDLDDALDEAIDDALTSSDDDEGGAAVVEHAASHPKAQRDCPLTFSRSAMRQRLPAALAALNDDHRAALDAATAARQRAKTEAAAAAADAAAAAAADAAAAEAQRRRAARAAADSAPLVPMSFDMSAATLSLLDFVGAAVAAPFQQWQHTQPSVQLQIVPAPPTCCGYSSDSGGAPPLGGQRAAEARRRGRPRRRRPQVRSERVWATVLALSWLQEVDSCWQLDEEDELMRTVVDAAHAFLDAQAFVDRRLRKLLKSGALHEAAERARKDWKAIQVRALCGVARTHLHLCGALAGLRPPHASARFWRIHRSVIDRCRRTPSHSCARRTS
jgi:hypothetical protein